MMAHVNPAHWIARIMITWSIVTGCMAAISKPWHFYLLRFLLVSKKRKEEEKTNKELKRCSIYL
jgi:hypothetical protein